MRVSHIALRNVRQHALRNVRQHLSRSVHMLLVIAATVAIVCVLYRARQHGPRNCPEAHLAVRGATTSNLLPHHFDDQPLAPLSVELAVEDCLPGPQVEKPFRYWDDHLVVHQ